MRGWLVVAALRAMRRAPHIHRLARIRDPARFVRAAAAPAGAHLALAIALLPRQRRAEATATLVACKAIAAFAAFGALDASQLAAAVAYLTGDSPDPPRVTAPCSTRSSDPFATLLIARLPLLRAALKALPGATHRRCYTAIERMGAAMLRARTDHRYRPDHIFAEAVGAAARIVVPAVHPPSFACAAWGRADYLATQLRNSPAGRERDAVLTQALRELPAMSRLLRWLPSSVDGGTRAAATLLAVTTYAFYLDLTGAPTPRLRHPLRAALASARSRKAYLATVVAIEDRVLEDGLQHIVAALTAGRPIPEPLEAFPDWQPQNTPTRAQGETHNTPTRAQGEKGSRRAVASTAGSKHGTAS